MAATFTIRPLTTSDQSAVTAALYDAIFVPEGGERPPPGIVDDPELRGYHEEFGRRAGDAGVVAVAGDGTVLGVAWVRLLRGYGHVDDDTPELSIAVAEAHRGRGIGSALLGALLELAPRCSLSVDLANRAVRLYERHGFRLLRVDGGHSAVMVREGP